MKTRIYGSELEELAIEANYPESFVLPDGTHYMERTYNTGLYIGQGQYKEIFFENVHIGYGDFNLKQPTLVYFDSTFETVEMHFALQGKARGHSDSFAENIAFGTNQHNLLYAYEFKGAIEWDSTENMKVFEINLRPAFFEKYIPDGRLFDLFKDAIARKQSTVLSRHHYPITPQMMILIHQIIHCSRSGHFKRMFMESQVLELLMLQLEQITSYRGKDHCTTQARHRDKLFAAKELLQNQMDRQFSLSSLAQEVGTNEFTLKKGFKELFGTTVFGYWNQLKMAEAQKWLSEGDMSIAEISAGVGYKNPQHFSTAFKRHFGYNPGELRMKR